MGKSQPQPCPGCNGTGQMTWFGGVSRFQFSYTDCPECNGFGFLDPEPDSSFLLTKYLTDNTDLSTTQASVFLQTLAQILTKTLAQGEPVRLRGFGNFSCKAGRTDSSEKIHFRPSKHLFKRNKTDLS